MRKMTFGVENLHGGAAAEMGFEVRDDGDRNRDVAGGLDDAAGNADKP